MIGINKDFNKDLFYQSKHTRTSCHISGRRHQTYSRLTQSLMPCS